ncbi:MAG TPA: hypothetical protein VGR47_00780 [Terracidiphilus sp.]|nr:hypothetical protein [Terracidiphilus sp.]
MRFRIFLLLLCGFSPIAATARSAGPISLRETPTADAGTTGGGIFTVYADQFSGSDCGAKINAADKSLGSAAGEIEVRQACGTAWTTPVVLSTGHNLRFIEGGTYSLPQGNQVRGNNVVSGLKYLTVLKLQANAGYSMWTTTDRAGHDASNVTFRDLTLDGNWESQTRCTSISACGHLIEIATTPRGGLSGVHIEGCAFQNIWARGAIAFVEYGHGGALTDAWIVNNQFTNADSHFIFVSAFTSGMHITGNQFKGWDLQSPGSSAAIFWSSGDNKPTYNWDISGNTFLNTTGAEFAVELFSGQATAWIDGLTFSHNVLDANGHEGGSGISIRVNKGTIVNNTWKNGGSVTRTGMELTCQDCTIADNSVEGGVITVSSSSVASSSHVNIIGNKIADSFTKGGRAAIEVSGYTARNPANQILVANNEIILQGTTGAGILTSYGGWGAINDLRIIANVFHANSSGASAINIGGVTGSPSTGLAIYGNSFDGTFGNGIYASNPYWTGAEIWGNKFSGAKFATAAKSLGTIQVSPVASETAVAIVATTYHGTGGISVTKLYTAPTAGTYRMCGYLEMSQPAAGGGFYLQAEFRSHGREVKQRVSEDLNPVQWSVTNSCTNLYLDSGSTVSWSLIPASVSGSPTVRFAITLAPSQ